MTNHVGERMPLRKFATIDASFWTSRQKKAEQGELAPERADDSNADAGVDAENLAAESAADPFGELSESEPPETSVPAGAPLEGAVSESMTTEYEQGYAEGVAAASAEQAALVATLQRILTEAQSSVQRLETQTLQDALSVLPELFRTVLHCELSSSPEVFRQITDALTSAIEGSPGGLRIAMSKADAARLPPDVIQQLGMRVTGDADLANGVFRIYSAHNLAELDLPEKLRALLMTHAEQIAEKVQQGLLVQTDAQIDAQPDADADADIGPDADTPPDTESGSDPDA